jgi:hypothetical protein
MLDIRYRMQNISGGSLDSRVKRALSECLKLIFFDSEHISMPLVVFVV